MVSAPTVGSRTDVCALADEIKKYRSRVVADRNSGNGLMQHPFKNSVVPPLVLLCLKVISIQFQQQPKAQSVPRQFLPEVMSRLPLDLDILLACPHVVDENYWKRRCLAKDEWKNMLISDHGLTWKQFYLEKFLQETLEAFDATEDDFDQLMEVIFVCRNFIFTLEVDQLLSHVDLDQAFTPLRNLTSLRLTYGVKSIGMQYERMLFGMKIADATSLAHYLQSTQTLTTLCLSSNLLDDDLLRMLMTGLSSNATIATLDLSHNKLTNHGARLLAKLLGPDSVLTTLRLCDNQIHAEGGRYLGRGLKYNTSLIELDMRLNRLTDDGGRMLLENMTDHPSLSVLHLGSNVLGSQTAATLGEMLEQRNSMLRFINLSNNTLNEEDAQLLAHSLKHNGNLVALDLRQNEIPEEAECRVEIAAKLRRNEVDTTAVAK